jgi:hypothetical protein
LKVGVACNSAGHLIVSKPKGIFIYTGQDYLHSFLSASLSQGEANTAGRVSDDCTLSLNSFIFLCLHERCRLVAYQGLICHPLEILCDHQVRTQMVIADLGQHKSQKVLFGIG